MRGLPFVHLSHKRSSSLTQFVRVSLIVRLHSSPEGDPSFAALHFPNGPAALPNIVDDPIHKLLKKLLASDDPVEFDGLSRQLRTVLHDRIEQLRRDAKSLRPKHRPAEPRKIPRNGTKKP